MPRKSLHKTFDNCLKEEGIIADKDYTLLHYLIDSDFYSQLSLAARIEKTSIDVEEVKQWIKSKECLNNQEALTDYLRVALGHLLCDILYEKVEFASKLQFLRILLLSYKSQGYCEATFDLECLS
jgi:hypothetical protein